MGKRKLNAATSLLTTVMLLIHAIIFSIRMIMRGGSVKLAMLIGWITMGLMLLHALISIDLALSAHGETETRKGKSYPKMNIPTIVQRASGVIMVPTAALHIAGATGLIMLPPAVHVIVLPLFFAIVLSHIAVSTSKAFITLGIGNAKFIKVVDIAMKVICGATLIAGVIGVYFWTFMRGAA